MFRALFAHHQEIKLYYTASGIVTLCRWPSGAQVQRGPCTGRSPTECDDSRCYITHYTYITYKGLDRFSTHTQISNFMEILTVGAELFHSDRRTDR